MLRAEKRRRRRCRYQPYGRAHTKCACPYQATGTLDGAFVRRSLKTSNCERAVALIRGWETAGSAREEKPIVIEEAVAAFMRDIGVRNVQEPAKRKFHTLLGERLLNFARKQGYPRLEDLNLHAVTEFRVTVQRMDPFTDEEFDRIPQDTHLYGDGHGRTGQLNAEELRVMVLALRFSGLRIGDAVKLDRTQLIPGAGRDGLPDVVGALPGLPPKSEKYFFWSGNGGLDTAVTNWRSRLEALFRLAESQTGGGKRFAHKPHPHRWRHAFAAEYPNAGVPIETVSLLDRRRRARGLEIKTGISSDCEGRVQERSLSQRSRRVSFRWIRSAAEAGIRIRR
jgi:integrase